MGAAAAGRMSAIALEGKASASLCWHGREQGSKRPALSGHATGHSETLSAPQHGEVNADGGNHSYGYQRYEGDPP